MNTTAGQFYRDLAQQWDQGKFVCVGLDPVLNKMPAKFQNLTPFDAVTIFTREIIDATVDCVCAYKPNAAYYEALGLEGHRALEAVVAYIKNAYPAIPVILDAKRGDIGETNAAYATAAFDIIGADAITVHPYFGGSSLEPFLSRQDKGVIVMAANSNPGAKELQDLPVQNGLPLYRHIAQVVAGSWNTHHNCGVTVGATEPHKIAEVRKVVGDMPLLILGVGTQGGKVEIAVKNGANSRKQGMIINSSRAILYASSSHDFQLQAHEAALSLNQQINAAIKLL